MKYLIIGLNFLVENLQATLENTIPPCGSGIPPPQENKKMPAHPFWQCFKIFRPPLQKGGGDGEHYGHLNEGFLFIGRFKVGSLPRMIHKEVLAQFIYKPT